MKKREQQGRPDACGWLWQLWREGGVRKEEGERERERECTHAQTEKLKFYKIYTAHNSKGSQTETSIFL